MRPPECPQCLRTILPEDTIVFGSWPSRSLRLSSASCTERRRAHDALYELPHHPLAACVRCAERFHLRDVASIDLRGVRAYSCPWCHTDPTDSIRVHLYGCAMLPAEVLERARQAREAARQLVKNRLQRRDHADVLMRETEAAVHALRRAIRQSQNRQHALGLAERQAT